MEDPVATLTGSVQQQRHQEQALAVDQQQQQPLFHQTPNDDLLGRHHHLSSPGVVAAQTFQKSRTAADAALDKLDPSTATVVTAATSASSITSSVVEPRPAMSVSSSPLAQLTSIATLQAEVLRTGTTRLTGAPLRDTSNSVQDVDQPSAASSSSSPPSPHPGIHPDYDSCPAIVKLPAGDWEQWLEKEKIHCRWNMIRLRKRDKQTFSRGPTACEWTREFQCEHAGQYRDRKDPNIDPSKKRKRSGSIKCNCPASIKMRKQFLEDEVVIEYFWKHEGHTPGVMEDIKAQRLPQDLKTWIKDRAIEGYEWKSVKTMMLSGTPTLDQVHPAVKENIKGLLPACYAYYANTIRQLKSKHSQESSSSKRDLEDVYSEDQDSPKRARQSHTHISPLETPDQQMASSSSRSLTTLRDQGHGYSAPQVHRDRRDILSSTAVMQEAWKLVGLNIASGNSASSQQQSDSTADQSERHTIAIRTFAAIATSLASGTATPTSMSAEGRDTSALSAHDSVQQTIDRGGSAPNDTHTGEGQNTQAPESIGLSLVDTAVPTAAQATPVPTTTTTDITEGDAGAHNNISSSSSLTRASSSSTSTSTSTSASSASDGPSVTQPVMPHDHYGSSESSVGLNGRERVETPPPKTLHQQRHQYEGQQQPRPHSQSQTQLQRGQPRDMMFEILRSISDLREQMEATQAYWTQEDATRIVDSFALPIRLMKEALERRNNSADQR